MIPIWPLAGSIFFTLFDMDVGVFATAAMAQVNAELKHIKAIRQYVFPEFGVNFPVFFCFSGQVKNTSTHIIRYAFKRLYIDYLLSYITFPGTIFFLHRPRSIWPGSSSALHGVHQRAFLPVQHNIQGGYFQQLCFHGRCHFQEPAIETYNIANYLVNIGRIGFHNIICQTIGVVLVLMKYPESGQ